MTLAVLQAVRGRLAADAQEAAVVQVPRAVAASPALAGDAPVVVREFLREGPLETSMPDAHRHGWVSGFAVACIHDDGLLPSRLARVSNSTA